MEHSNLIAECSPYIVPSEANPNLERNNDSESNESTVDCCDFDERDKKMLPCVDFIAGSCEKKCMFYHPSKENIATAIRSPSFPEGFGTQEAVDAAVKDLFATGIGDDPQNKRSRSGPGGYGPPVETDRSVTFFQNPRGRSLPLRQRLAAPRHRRGFNNRFLNGRGRENDEGTLERMRPQGSRPWTRRPLFPYEDYGRVSRNYVHPENSLSDSNHYVDYNHQYVTSTLLLPPKKFSPVLSEFQMSDGYDHLEYDWNGYDPRFQEAYEEEHQIDTMFKHIDWKNFLAPGQMPPPIMNTILLDEPLVRKKGRNLLEMMVEPAGRNPSQPTMDISSGSGYVNTSAKQELRMKFSQIAAELEKVKVTEVSCQEAENDGRSILPKNDELASVHAEKDEPSIHVEKQDSGLGSSGSDDDSGIPEPQLNVEGISPVLVI